MSDKYGKGGWDHKREQLARIEADEMRRNRERPERIAAAERAVIEAAERLYDARYCREAADAENAIRRAVARLRETREGRG